MRTEENVEEFAIEGYDEEALGLLEEEVLYALQKYLKSAVFRDVGPVTARRVVSHFGISTPEVIEHAYKRLLEVHGVGPKRMLAIKKGWSYQRNLIEKCAQLIKLRSINTEISIDVSDSGNCNSTATKARR
jgi:ATP-dependent exoDNAse (exonuclease V) alpha subunit